MLCGVVTLTGFLGKLWWLLELTSHFPLHLAVASALFTGIWALKRRWRWTIFSGAVTAVNALLVLALFWPVNQSAPAAGQRLRLVAVNVHTANLRTELVLDFLQKTDADVVLLMEVNQRWMDALSSLSNRYPEIIAEARSDNFGIAMLNRVAATNSAVIYLGEAEVPSIRTTLLINGQTVTLLGTHPLPPGSAEYASLRNDQLRQITAAVRESSAPTILLGDLNATPWSPYFQELLRASGLRNTSQGRGLYGSWPAGLPVGRIPLDHCLVSPSIHVVDKHLGPQVGSDHLPVVVDLQIPTP
ncbi:MAG: endonuclease/exonuclease/phosphatase family protein [Akkermansiaceae bacterium]|nr:endonuclease/exonuclease/phosphatase family protein [Verrucomicrobiales bacterium]